MLAVVDLTGYSPKCACTAELYLIGGAKGTARPFNSPAAVSIFVDSSHRTWPRCFRRRQPHCWCLIRTSENGSANVAILVLSMAELPTAEEARVPTRSTCGSDQKQLAISVVLRLRQLNRALNTVMLNEAAPSTMLLMGSDTSSTSSQRSTLLLVSTGRQTALRDRSTSQDQSPVG